LRIPNPYKARPSFPRRGNEKTGRLESLPVPHRNLLFLAKRSITDAPAVYTRGVSGGIRPASQPAIGRLPHGVGWNRSAILSVPLSGTPGFIRCDHETRTRARLLNQQSERRPGTGAAVEQLEESNDE
jgi:hypothetical protein